MSDNDRIACDRDTRIENFAAELTCAIYPIVLRRGPISAWLTMELSLWSALAETVKKWARQRPPATSSDQVEGWREELLVDLTESAFHVAVKNGVKAPLLEVELCLYRAIRLVIKGHSRVGASTREDYRLTGPSALMN